jgi:hypothetical protein
VGYLGDGVFIWYFRTGSILMEGADPVSAEYPAIWEDSLAASLSFWSLLGAVYAFDQYWVHQDLKMVYFLA